jgi:integrase
VSPASTVSRGVFLLGQVGEGRAVRSPRTAADEPVAPRAGQGGIAANTLYGQLKRFFIDCAATLDAQGDARSAERLRRASTHWLRHTHASHALAAGVPIDVAQQNLGHASLATTTVYAHSESKRRLTALGALWGKG